mgnify:CR=1 FL=1
MNDKLNTRKMLRFRLALMALLLWSIGVGGHAQTTAKKPTATKAAASKTATSKASQSKKSTAAATDDTTNKKKKTVVVKKTTVIMPNKPSASPTLSSLKETVADTTQTSGQSAEAPDKESTATEATTEAAAPALATAQTATCGYLSNPPLPYMPVKLDVLFIGNSFSIDTSTALPEIFNSVGISNVNVYVLYKGGCSMRQHYEYYKSGEAVYELWQYNINGGKKIETACSIRDVMRREAYDVVVFQQYSLESGDYSSYEPYLSRIIQAYNITKLSSRTTFAFNQTWAYSSKHKNISKYGTPLAMYRKICDSVRKMKAISGIDVIIPCGTAVQNARSVAALVTENEFTRDNQHIDLYMGRYLLACTFFESIIAPCIGRNIRNDITIYGKQGTTNMVNSQNRHILQNCARLAVANNFEVSEFAGQ